jgi:Ca-activated chloride channel family protein
VARPPVLAGGSFVPASTTLVLTLDRLDFGSPWRLVVLLIVPVALALVLVVARRQARGNVLFTNLDTLALTTRRGTDWKRLVPLVLLALAFAAAVVAFAQPRVPDAVTDHSTSILLLADVSGSMQATDVRPSRLAAAIAAMRDFLAAVPQDDRVGLMTFSDATEVLAPPTTDRSRVESNLRLLEPQGGTALGSAVTAAVRVLLTSLAGEGIQRRPGKQLPAAIVIESDGAQDRGTVTPLEGADAAQAAGIPIYGVALGTRHGFITEGDGPLSRSVRVLPDPGVMALLARQTGGTSFTATTAAGLDSIYRSLALGIDRHPGNQDVSALFEAVAAILLVAAVGAGIVLGPALP